MNIEFRRGGLISAVARRIVKRSLSVTRDDLGAGEPGHAMRCPVALAARRIFPDARALNVTGERITVSYVDRIEQWATIDASLEAYIARIDDTGARQPYEQPGHISLAGINERTFTIRLVARRATHHDEGVIFANLPTLGERDAADW